MKLTFKQLKYGILILLIIPAGFFSCSKTKKREASVPKLSRDYRINPNSRNGLIYGKVIHNKSFGNRFTISFKNLKTQAAFKIRVEALSADTSKNIFLEFEPGEWLVDQVTMETGEKINVSELRQEEHKEFIVEKAGISYIGTWVMSPEKFKVLDHKADQDLYMRMNYKNVMTASALVSLP
jgi:hypothetical protein